MIETPMERRLGRSGIAVSGLGLGCWAIGGPFWSGSTALGWGEVDDEESKRAIRAALEQGVRFFDTADVYGAGRSERVLGEALGSDRNDVVVATKFGNVFDEESKQVTGSDASPEYVKRACEASLKRLNTDFIDLYQLHIGDLSFDEARAVRDALEELVAEGKIRSYGWSTNDADRARFFADGRSCTACQHEMNVLNDAPDVVGVCDALDLASINRGPLAMGLLSGKYGPDTKPADDDVRGKNSPEWMQYFENGKPSRAWLDRLQAVREVLTFDGRSLAQGALGWLWARSEQCVPIPGFRTVDQVEENAGAMRFGALTQAQRRQIAQILQSVTSEESAE